jgi:hypothetical protein
MTMSWISLFVVHGIRDDGYWTRKIAQKIHEAAEKGSLRGEPSFGKLQCTGYRPIAHDRRSRHCPLELPAIADTPLTGALSL